jgi:uncharacterized protein (TIGR02722 family)
MRTGIDWFFSRAVWTPLILVAACAGPQVSRMAVTDVSDVSGHWNDTDARLTAEEMIGDCLAHSWLARAQSSLGHTPTVVVGRVRNQSHEHIRTEPFVEELQRALINSGQVEFVASDVEKEELRDERLDQDVNASESTRKEHGQETGADFLLAGTINTIQDRRGGDQVILYQINLKLLDVRTNRIAWNGQKKIKKAIKRPSVEL